MSVSNFAMVAVSYGPLGMQSENWTLATALLLLGGFTLATLSFGALFMFYVPAKMRATFYKYKTWGMHLDTYYWDDKLFDRYDGIELRGHEAVRANLPMWNSGKLLMRASMSSPRAFCLSRPIPLPGTHTPDANRDILAEEEAQNFVQGEMGCLGTCPSRLVYRQISRRPRHSRRTRPRHCAESTDETTGNRPGETSEEPGKSTLDRLEETLVDDERQKQQALKQAQ